MDWIKTEIGWNHLFWITQILNLLYPLCDNKLMLAISHRSPRKDRCG